MPVLDPGHYQHVATRVTTDACLRPGAVTVEVRSWIPDGNTFEAAVSRGRFQFGVRSVAWAVLWEACLSAGWRSRAAPPPAAYGTACASDRTERGSRSAYRQR
jgi:hypothetical protein